MKKTYKYHIITFGCQMNKNDSERMETILNNMGLQSVNKPEQADIILLNSCSVRESAESRIYGQTHNFAKLKKDNPDLIIGVTGCMPGRDKDGKLRKKLPWVDLFFPNEDMVHLPQWLSQLNPNLRFDDLGEDYLSLKPNYHSDFQAFVSIKTGCDHFCTYCVVPYARGLAGDRTVKSILEEINNLAQRGYKEVTLLGQITNHYNAPDPENFSKNNPYQESDFAKLLWEVNQVSGFERLTWVAAHPTHMTAEVIAALNLPKQINYLHLPIQSGNSGILHKMNRRHDREFYLDLIKKIRAKRPGIAIATDIIVGFCGETEEQFQDTVSLYKECDFDISYHAQYSTRSGTVAAKQFEDDVPKEEKRRRWQVLQDLMEEITYRKNQAYVGKKVSVLVEKCKAGWCFGNSSEMKLVKFKGSEALIGTIVELEVYKADTWLLWGRVI